VLIARFRFLASSPAVAERAAAALVSELHRVDACSPTLRHGPVPDVPGAYSAVLELVPSALRRSVALVIDVALRSAGAVLVGWVQIDRGGGGR
jgi:hypothetical protein